MVSGAGDNHERITLLEESSRRLDLWLTPLVDFISSDSYEKVAGNYIVCTKGNRN